MKKLHPTSKCSLRILTNVRIPRKFTHTLQSMVHNNKTVKVTPVFFSFILSPLCRCAAGRHLRGSTHAQPAEHVIYSRSLGISVQVATASFSHQYPTMQAQTLWHSQSHRFMFSLEMGHFCFFSSGLVVCLGIHRGLDPRVV